MDPQLHHLLEHLANLLRGEARVRGAALGLAPVHVEVLNYLARCNRYSDTPMAVADYLGQTRGTVSQTVKVLEEKGLVRRRADPDDGRKVHLHLTAAAEALLAPPDVDVPESEAAAIQGILTALLVRWQTARGRASFGVCASCRLHQREGGRARCGLTGEVLSVADAARICREHAA